MHTNEEIFGAVTELKTEVQSLKVELDKHVRDEILQYNRFMDAFPDGPEKHRDAHQSMIDAYTSQKKFFDELRLEIAKKGVWFLFITLLGLLVVGVQVKLGIIK